MKIKDKSAALAVINYCLETEDKDFWLRARDRYETKAGKQLIKVATARGHVYGLALAAVGVEFAASNLNSYYVGDDIVDEAAAIEVIEYYLSLDEAENYAQWTEENSPDEETQKSHVYRQALAATASPA